ncbi:hypothetical protein DdX_01431 [Ditylenchus destructor]|uniref:Uncharacterized protein n=1 Tax=Ditylenchus destructor TaxID=166010 RepID=A0AAD4NLT4_9BILA|nr:hypothetical protein DdX_01431 [Ditylenchus destructor]
MRRTDTCDLGRVDKRSSAALRRILLLYAVSVQEEAFRLPPSSVRVGLIRNSGFGLQTAGVCKLPVCKVICVQLEHTDDAKQIKLGSGGVFGGLEFCLSECWAEPILSVYKQPNATAKVGSPP